MQACHLKAHEIACRRGDRLLFAGLSLSLESGQALQVAGSNGIGKSSLIRILAGLARPFEGEVAREGRVGLMDERPALDEHQPLGKALAFWASLDGCDAAPHAETLGIGALLDVPVRYLSTGQRKRAAFARLLGQEAPIWLLDEPLNGLDRHGVELLEDLTARHCAKGGIALIASHQTFRLDHMVQIQLAEFTL